jgi:hypothetical protein
MLGRIHTCFSKFRRASSKFPRIFFKNFQKLREKQKGAKPILSAIALPYTPDPFWTLEQHYESSNLQPQFEEVLKKQDKKAFCKLVTSGFSLAVLLSGSKNVYHIAAELNLPEMIRYIAASHVPKPDINARDSVGWTPLHAAFSDGNLSAALALLNCGASPNITSDSGVCS